MPFLLFERQIICLFVCFVSYLLTFHLSQHSTPHPVVTLPHPPSLSQSVMTTLCNWHICIVLNVRLVAFFWFLPGKGGVVQCSSVQSSKNSAVQRGPFCPIYSRWTCNYSLGFLSFSFIYGNCCSSSICRQWIFSGRRTSTRSH